MKPETLPHKTSRATSNHRIANFSRSNHAQPRSRPGRQLAPIRNQASECQPLAFLTHPREIAALFDSRRSAEPETLWGFGGHAPARLRLNRRQALASHPAAVAENGLATLARIAVQKPVLAFPPDFRWLILSFHKLLKLADLSVRVQGTILPGKHPKSKRARVTAKTLLSTEHGYYFFTIRR